MKKLKKVISLLIVMVMIVSMFAISNVTSSAYGISWSPETQTVDKATSTTATLTRNVDTFWFTYYSQQYLLGHWVYVPMDIYVQFDDYGISADKGATASQDGNTVTVNISDVKVGDTVTVSTSGKFWGTNGDKYAEDTLSATAKITVTCSHTGKWGSGTVTTTPTCTNSGIRTYTCSVCGATKDETENALGHNYVGTVTAPTCTQQGYTTYNCSRCDSSYVDNYVEALGHSWNSGEVLVPPTPDEMGTTRYTCTRCGLTRDEVDIPVLTGIDVLIYDAGAIITQYNNGELFTEKDGFSSTWTDFMSAYNGAIAAKSGTEEDINDAAVELIVQTSAMSAYRPLNVTALQAAIALTPEYSEHTEYYTDSSFALWSTTRSNAQTFVSQASTGEKALSDSLEMEDLVSELTFAYNNLELKRADYTALNAVRNREEVQNVDLYVSEVADPVRAILAQIDYDLAITEQATVDDWTTRLTAAAANLTTANLDYADYTQVDAAIARANALTSSNYTNYADVTAAINAVDRTVLRGEQDTVDAMAQAINDAIDALIPARANYNELTSRVEYAESLNSEMYINYFAVQNIIDTIDWNLDVFHQSEVDAVVIKLNNAISALEYADADYSAVTTALERIDTLGNLDDFVDESLEDLQEAVSTVEYSLKINEQARVNAMAQAINDAIDAMQIKLADYTSVENAVSALEMLDESSYINYSVVTYAINAIDWTIDIRHQADVEALAQSLLAVQNELVAERADYTAVNEKLAQVEEMIENSEYPYDETSIAEYEAFVDTLDMDLDIFHQGTVDSYIDMIEAAANDLRFILADYTELNAALESANAIDRTLYEDLSELDGAVRDVDYEVTIDRQSEVDAMKDRINTALANLQMLPADYSELDMYLQEYEAINRSYYSAEDMQYVDAVIESTVVRGLKKDQQSDVNTMAQTVYAAIRYLDDKMLPADVTGLETAVENANAKVILMQSQGYAIEPELLENLQNLIDSTVQYDGAYISAQGEIDELTQQIIDAADALEYVFTITEDTTAIIEDGLIYGFEEGVTAAEIQSMVRFVGTANFEVVETANGLGTGSRVIYTDNEGNILGEYTVVIFGDANGDGWIDMFDVSIISEIANSGAEVDEHLNEALDVNNDGFVDAYDVAIVISIANMDASISQDGNFIVA